MTTSKVTVHPPVIPAGCKRESTCIAYGFPLKTCGNDNFGVGGVNGYHQKQEVLFMEDRRKRGKGNNVNWLWLFVALFVGVGGTAVFFALNNRVQPAPIIIVPPEPTATQAPSPTPAPLTVFVNGAVVAPGVVKIPANGRLQDAIAAADGFTEDANTAVVNLAQPLQDGVQIYVPAIDDEGETAVIQPSSVVIEAAPAETGSNGGQININTATAAELETLPGVGPSTAAKIITHRQENGDFANIEAVMDVSGIGEAKFAAMSALITIEN